MATRKFESLGGGVMDVTVDEDGFATVHVVHPACGSSTAYASGPLDMVSDEAECIKCGKILLRCTADPDGEVVDASEL